MPVVRLRHAPIPGGALHPCPVALGRLPPAPPRPAACRGRLRIGYQIAADRLQGQVEFAYRTERRQVLTTILWGGRIDDVSRQLLTDALRLAADGRFPLRLPTFAVAARDLFRHASHTMAARHRCRARRKCFAHATRDEQAPHCVPEAAPLHDDLLAAAGDLRNRIRLQPHVTIAQGPRTDASLQAALSALQELSDLIGDYLEQVLWPLAPHIGHHAVHAFILETRREPRELASCRTPGDVYVETFTIAQPDDRAVTLEVEGFLGATGP